MKLKQICLVIFVFVWGTHFLSKTITVTDSWGVLPVSMSIIREHNTNLDEYKSLIAGKHENATEIINGHCYYFLPVGTSLLVAPILKTLDFFCRRILYMDINQAIASGYSGGIELFIASLIIALTSVFIFLTAFEITRNKGQSLLAVFVFAFCTSAWSVASRALWSHTCSMLLLSITLFSLLRAKHNQKWLWVAGLAVAYAYVVRPTNSLSVFFFSLFVLIEYRKKTLPYIIAVALVLLPFIAYNYHIYHFPLSSYYLPRQLKVGGNTFLGDALLANLFSPARGLFIFSSVLLFSVVGIVVSVRQKSFSRLSACVLLIILSHYYLISSINTPYAGWSFGPRYFCDMVPFFIYFLVFFIAHLSEMKMGAIKLGLSALLVLFIATSFYINYKGATHPATFMWNAQPNIDEHPERVWDWKDLQFLR